MQGKIVKGIAGFYYVHVVESGVYECKAKGIFRKDKKKPLVGDDVEIEVLSEVEKTGSIINIFERKNELIRPAVANIDQALVVFAAAKPSPHFNLLDRFLVMMQTKEIPVILCFNKEDIASEEKLSELAEIYEKCGCQLIFVSAKEEKNMETLRRMLEGKTTAIAGPSGVGKSSIINLLNPKANMETGSISRKIERGKHTTRHSEIFYLGHQTFLFDTPGFSSLDVLSLEKEELELLFPEFAPYLGKCRFTGCSHISEPSCGVKEAVQNGKISKNRYESYTAFYKELNAVRRYK